MYRSSPARKYGPLAAIVVAQLVVVLVAPSTAPPATSDVLATSGLTGLSPSTPLTADAAAAVASGEAVVLPDGSVVATDSAEAAAAGLGGATSTGAGPTATGPAGATASTPGAPGTTAKAPGTTSKAPGTAANVAGDTTHCVGGRQFDPKIEFFAPPCVPGKPGAAVANPGATSMGVTKDKITVVHYIPDYGAEVNAILRAQGLFYDASNARIANAAFQKFMNSKYNLSGRKIEIKTFQGTCRTVPPDLQCLIPEMNRIVDENKPYAVFFQTTVCSACYAELARRKVVTFGGDLVIAGIARSPKGDALGSGRNPSRTH